MAQRAQHPAISPQGVLIVSPPAITAIKAIKAIRPIIHTNPTAHHPQPARLAQKAHHPPPTEPRRGDNIVNPRTNPGGVRPGDSTTPHDHEPRRGDVMVAA